MYKKIDPCSLCNSEQWETKCDWCFKRIRDDEQIFGLTEKPSIRPIASTSFCSEKCRDKEESDMKKLIDDLVSERISRVKDEYT